MFSLIDQGEYYKWLERRKNPNLTPDFLNNLQVLVVGGGSVGKRYLGLLLGLRINNLAIVDPREDRRAEISERFNNVRVYETEEDAYLSQKYNVVVIANPPAFHIESGKKAITQGAHVLMEKSISNQIEGVEEFLKTAEMTKRLVGVCYVYRFYDTIRFIKNLLENGALGKIFSAQLTFSEYLPDWHSWEPPLSWYVSRKDLGGSELLDENHTVDLARMFFGEIREIAAHVGRASDLTVDSDDFAELICFHEGGTLSQIHQDAFGRKHRKNMWIMGEKGVVFWDSYLGANRVELHQGNPRKVEIFPGRISRNDTFFEVLRDFLESVASGKQPEITGWEALKTLKVCKAAERSSNEGRRIQII